ncbi:MAG TPA: TetR/AcrR family transcriptional regulator [Thermodesulfovibrionales bacterium]|nr:TetR/AcrR family transcriptional regulator [Thermodesulfovibrionales bacterium]
MNKRSGKESKRKILSAATKVFSVYGYKGASMRMIAQAADISLGGLYLYFKNKEDLYTTLIRIRLNDLAEETREVLGDIDDPTQAIRTFITMRVNYAKKHRELVLLLGKEQGLTFGIKARKQFFREQRRVIEEIVRKGIASGGMRNCKVEEIAKIIICALRGFILSMLVEPDALFSPEACSTLILEGLQVPNPESRFLGG